MRFFHELRFVTALRFTSEDGNLPKDAVGYVLSLGIETHTDNPLSFIKQVIKRVNRVSFTVSFIGAIVCLEPLRLLLCEFFAVKGRNPGFLFSFLAVMIFVALHFLVGFFLFKKWIKRPWRSKKSGIKVKGQLE